MLCRLCSFGALEHSRMKKIVRSFLVSALAAVCISWGTTGHFTVGQIAEKHLTPAAKNAVKDLLGNESLADVSTWADDVRGESEYKATGPWHYINLPSGLDSQAFVQKVLSMPGDNVYKAVLKCEQDLRSNGASRKEKTKALKFLVHLVGDLHQPMHVSHAEDKGGNTIQVQYKGKGSNLHSVWDSKLLDDQEMDYKALAEKLDKEPRPQVAPWKKNNMLTWLWESYQVSERLYNEVGTNNRKLKDDYYRNHIDISNKRLQLAGLRLASVLNSIFDNNYHAPAGSIPKEETPRAVKIEEAGKHIGEYATVCSKVYGHKDFEGLTLVNLGDRYPNSPMTVVLKGEAKASLTKLDGKNICVTGKIIDYKGKPEIVITDSKKIEFSKGQ